MASFITRRLLQTFVVLLVMSFVVYGLMGLMPGDPVDIMAASQPGMTPEVMANLRAIYGLDQPLMVRYERWLMAVQMTLEMDTTGTAQPAIIQTARHTAAMYLMQFQHVLTAQA